MSTQLEDHLKRRHEFEGWRGRNTMAENLLVWRFFLSGSEFIGWEPLRIQSAGTPGGQPGFQSTWKRPGGGPDALLRLDVFECNSRLAAHEFLIQVLGEFESPLLARDGKTDVGDVAFGIPGGRSIVFARANLVISVRNAGRELIPVTELARELDHDLASRPKMGATEVVPAIHRFSAGRTEISVSGTVSLELEASDPLGRALWFKFFSSSGKVVLEEGRPVYQPEVPGPQEITVFAINANRGAASLTLEVFAK